MVAREDDEQQPNIEALKRNPKVSWQGLEETIQHWCASTISRRHIKESRKCDGLKVLSEAEILENSKSVWNQLPNHQIASAYIQAHRIANKVIKAGGDNQ
jgi:hypothetical protein